MTTKAKPILCPQPDGRWFVILPGERTDFGTHDGTQVIGKAPSKILGMFETEADAQAFIDAALPVSPSPPPRECPAEGTPAETT